MVNKNPLKIQEMFNRISKKYDFLNEVISFGLHKKIKKSAFKNLKIKEGDKILDLCTGTGDIAHILKNIEHNAEVYGLDFSPNMLEIAKKRHEGDKINFAQGDVCNLKFEDGTVNIVTMSFGLRNIENRKLALSEINRVLSLKGLFANLDFSPQNKFLNFIFDKFTIIFAKVLSKNYEAYKYLIDSKNEFKVQDELIKEFEEAGFRCVFKKNYLFGIIGFQICEKIKSR